MTQSFHFPYGGKRKSSDKLGVPALNIHNLSVDYPTSGQGHALDNVSLWVPNGTRMALVGPNGAGKSTLLKTIVGLLPIQSGSVDVYGQPITACRQRVAYLPQRGEIDWRFPISLRKLVLTGRYIHLGWFKHPTVKDKIIADKMIDRLGLSAVADRQIGQLSGGQQQRALLARALTQEADLVLLDEPLNAVDVNTRAIIDDVLKQLQHEGKTVVAATHDLGRLETDFDAVLYLADGHEVQPPGSFVGMDMAAPNALALHSGFREQVG